ncbi:MAG: tetratricopeptide repeat protein [Fibrobacteria bacterium]|nr:tetratricopeptide repeat protein [Fibrobacteria bacterium]
MKKNLLNIVTGLLITFGILGLTELGLYIAGIKTIQQTEDPFVGYASSSPLYVPHTAPDGNKLMVMAPGKRSWFNKQVFLRSKPEGCLRIFTLGGSTTYGRPYNDSTSFSRWLREYLPAADSSKHWEVVNAGGISYASYRIAELMKELVQYQPDLFIVYTGHNEFLEERTYRKVASIPDLVRETSSLLGKTRLYTTMQRGYQKIKGDRKKKLRKKYHMTGEVKTLLDNSFGPASYHRDDSLRTKVLQHYRYSLQRIVQTAKNAGVKVILCTTPANIKDCSPFKSQYTKGLSQNSRNRLTLLLKEGKTLEQQGLLNEALERYNQAIKLDTQYAELLYRTGKVLLKLERFQEASVMLNRALNEDICPLRALPEMSSIVLETGKQMQIPVVDFKAFLEEKISRNHKHAIPGSDEFLDHVHPTIESNRLLALEIIRKMVTKGIVTSGPQWGEALIQQIKTQVEAGIDSSSHGLALHNLAKVLNWAGKYEDAAHIAERAIGLLPSHLQALTSYQYVGTAKERSGKTEEAIVLYRRALALDSNNPETNRLLGKSLAWSRQYAEAERRLQTSLKYGQEEDIEILWDLGMIQLQQQNFLKAVAWFERAVNKEPGNPRIHFYLAEALYLAGRSTEASGEYLRTMQLNPKDAEAHAALGQILLERGQRSEAIKYFSRALQLNPQIQRARQGLAAALANQNKPFLEKRN